MLSVCGAVERMDEAERRLRIVIVIITAAESVLFVLAVPGVEFDDVDLVGVLAAVRELDAQKRVVLEMPQPLHGAEAFLELTFNLEQRRNHLTEREVGFTDGKRRSVRNENDFLHGLSHELHLSAHELRCLLCTLVEDVFGMEQKSSAEVHDRVAGRGIHIRRNGRVRTLRIGDDDRARKRIELPFTQDVLAIEFFCKLLIQDTEWDCEHVFLFLPWGCYHDGDRIQIYRRFVKMNPQTKNHPDSYERMVFMIIFCVLGRHDNELTHVP